MNFKQKLGYMFIGCLFTIAGYIIASLGSGATHAQQNEQVIDKIVCKRLEVVNTKGTTIAMIHEGVGKGGRMEFRNSDGKLAAIIESVFRNGNISILSEDGGGVTITVLKQGGVINVNDKDGTPVGFFGANEDGGRTVFYNKDKNKDINFAASIGATKDGGAINLYNNDYDKVVAIGSNEDSNGFIAVGNNDGKTAVGISASKDGGHVHVNNKNKKVVAAIGATKDGNGAIQSYEGGWRTH